ncbi:hypothetical protein BX661DRAFT_199543 [Kickxella alabastrina]|uniref:uncharacterized protein n=1 Tax=Kickxella alabastrina TaxID=61397 RepID=UPI0022200802|nr:uncharacterized protein BX661DRAFT_199543 [Kickxella alabastrina]KAI7825021.1 hypothetical protein BX661DRAFT_199543 [Kickxella alabastrina]
MRKLDDSPVSFSQRLFYLYGYSTEPESENSKHGIHSADAHGEELRRRNKARRTLEVALNEAGAQATTDADKGTAADYVVITDECSPEQREKALALGLPVINESVVLEKIQQPSALIISGEPDASVFAAVVASNNRLRPSVSLEGMAIRKLHAADASKAAVRRRPRGSVSSASSSSSELGHGPLAGPSGSGLGDDEYRERQEWRDMLASALTGEVVDNEKKRLISQGDSTPMMAGIGQTGDMSELVQNVDFQSMLRKMHVDMWLGCRAAIRGRTPQQEKQTLESLRAVHVDTTLRAVLDYSAAAECAAGGPVADLSARCLGSLQKLLRRVDYVEGMYPTLSALGVAKPTYVLPEFQKKLETITSWTNVVVRLELLFNMMQRWTGSSDLSLFSTAVHGEYAGSGAVETPPTPTPKQGFKHTPFVERLMKENGTGDIFGKRILTELEHVLMSARADMIANGGLLTEIGLPLFNRHMQELLCFPPRLLRTWLQMRLQSVENLNNPAPAQVDQLIEDIRDSMALACRIKRTFKTFSGPTGLWNPEVQLDDEYDATLRSCLKMYFWLLQRKLQLTISRGITKEFDILESQWPFLVEVVRDIDGGPYELALRYCQQTRHHVREWTRSLAGMLRGPSGYETMGSRDLSKWIGNVLQLIRTPILGGQRLMRALQGAVVNAADYVFANAYQLLAQLVDTKHVLVYTSGDWEARGVYVVGSPALLEKPHMARELLASCIVDDRLTTQEHAHCYLLVIRTEAEFNWTGATIVPEGGIPVQDLQLRPGQMRLISPGILRLAAHRDLLVHIGVAEKIAPGDCGTSATDAVIGEYVRGRQSRLRRRQQHQQNKQQSQHHHHRQPTKSSRNMFEDDEDDNTGNGGDDDGDELGSDGDGEDKDDQYEYLFEDTNKFFAALRPSMSLSKHKLKRASTAGQHGLSASGSGGGGPRPLAPSAHVYELARPHDPLVQKEWSLLKYEIVRIFDALTQVPDMLRTLHLDVHEREFHEKPDADPTCHGGNCDLLDLVQDNFWFASNTALRGSRFLDLKSERCVRAALARMCVGWCGFIAEDCQASEQRTFRWAVQALEFTLRLGRHSSTLQTLPRADWLQIKSHVAGCLTLMISHFDVLGARTAAARRLQRMSQSSELQLNDPNSLLSLDGIGANFRTHMMQRQRVNHAQKADELRDQFLASEKRIGRVLEVTARPEDRTLRLLAASSSNITLRWQIGRYIGGGAFGSVYAGYNLDTGEMMAVKEIRLPSRGLNQAPSESDMGLKIVREMEILSVLQHPNIVTYYGIEVHRDKVYLFMELCTRGSLAQLIRDQGRFDEDMTKEYVVQMLRGLEYLHSFGVCHRDIKCDNTLLDEGMNIKLVDFGAAKILDKQSIAVTRRSVIPPEANAVASLTGTPKYMAPEVILSSNGGSTVAGRNGTETLRPGRLGAQDIWSLGCCIVEMVTGSPPWAHLDNDWSVMYHVVAGNMPMPDSSAISPEGMRFLRRCFARQPADRPEASELLRDKWIIGIVRLMERRGSRSQTASSSRQAPSDSEREDSLNTPNNADQFSSEVPTEDTAQPGHSFNSLSSTGSHLHMPGRSRNSSFNRKNLSGDLRFTNSLAGPSADVMLSMMERSGESGSSSLALSAGGDRSPSVAGGLLVPAGGAKGLMSHMHSSYNNVGTMSPLARTPGSPHSTTSAHASAWPFNKELGGTGLATTQATIANTATGGGIGLGPDANYPLTSSGSQSGQAHGIGSFGNNASAANSVGTSSISNGLATSEELAAIYSHPSVIYQTLSDTATDMGSPVGPAGVSQFAITNTPSAFVSSPDNMLPSTLKQLSSDQIQDLSDTTRKALSAMLSLPLEGADVAGVSGWLGEGNTPMEMFDAEEVKETVATTSQLIMRQREQQLRRQQQELRYVMHRQQSQKIIKSSGGLRMGEKSALSDYDVTLLQQLQSKEEDMVPGDAEGESPAKDSIKAEHNKLLVKLANIFERQKGKSMAEISDGFYGSVCLTTTGAITASTTL